MKRHTPLADIHRQLEKLTHQQKLTNQLLAIQLMGLSHLSSEDVKQLARLAKDFNRLY